MGSIPTDTGADHATSAGADRVFVVQHPAAKHAAEREKHVFWAVTAAHVGFAFDRQCRLVVWTLLHTSWRCRAYATRSVSRTIGRRRYEGGDASRSADSISTDLGRARLGRGSIEARRGSIEARRGCSSEGLSMPVEGRGQRSPNRAYRIREFVESRGSRDPRAEGLALRVASLPTVFRASEDQDGRYQGFECQLRQAFGEA